MDQLRERIQTAVLATPQVTDPTAVSVEQSVSRADFDAFERQMTNSLRSGAENLEDQKADLKTLSDPVIDLAAKVDALRNATATAPTAPIQNSISGQPVVPPRPAAIGKLAPNTTVVFSIEF